jgi:predicted Zn finger-like uncharacterized protein
MIQSSSAPVRRAILTVSSGRRGMIRFSCDQCGAQFKVADEKGGKRGKCPRCQAVMQIPPAAGDARP